MLHYILNTNQLPRYSMKPKTNLERTVSQLLADYCNYRKRTCFSRKEPQTMRNSLDKMKSMSAGQCQWKGLKMTRLYM